MTNSAIDDTGVGFLTAAWPGAFAPPVELGGVLRALDMTVVSFPTQATRQHSGWLRHLRSGTIWGKSGRCNGAGG